MKKIKPHGLFVFNHFMDILEELLNKAGKQKNPALWLYRNDARTPLFMLEALARLYTGVNKENKFIKLDAKFKLLEDTLGAIDYYDVFAKEFIQNKKIPAEVTAYMQAQAREKTQQLNEILTEKKWLNENNDSINKIRKKLSNADWKKEAADIKSIHHFYTDAINHILVFVNKEDFHFENIETDVHELRRKLRWLSIYPQALLGSVQLRKQKKYPAYLHKYMDKETVNSPFNKMPNAGTNKHFLLLSKDYLYSLSWLIAELGKIKDNGLRVIVIKEALQQISSLSDEEALKKVYQITGSKQLGIQQLVNKADSVCKTYFKEKNLEKLVIGISTIK